MAKPKLKSTYPLFQSLARAIEDANPLFRENFFEAVRGDVPDLDAIFQAQEESVEKDKEYSRVQFQTNNFRQVSSFNRGTSGVGWVDFLYTHLPQVVPNNDPNAKITYSAYSLGHKPHLLPLAFIFTDHTFNQALSGSDRVERASQLMAEILYASNDDKNQMTMSEPVIASRINTLLEHIDPARVGVYWDAIPFEKRNKDITQLGGKFFEKLAERKDPWAQALCTLFKEEITPRIDAMQAAHKAQTHPVKQRKKAADAPGPIELPRNGSAVMLLEARAELNLILDKIFFNQDKKLDAAWLNRPEVWAAVRSTSNQEAFIKTCAKRGAFKNETPFNADEKEEKKEASSKPVNELLKNLDLPVETAPLAKKGNEAQQAFEGYMNTITSASELGVVAQLLRRIVTEGVYVEKGSTYKTSEYFPGVLSKTAERLGFSPADAHFMMSNTPWNESAGDIAQDILSTLNGGRWTAEEVNALFSSRPLLHSAHSTISILRSTVQSDPAAWSKFSDDTIYKLAQGWAYSDNNRMWEDEDAYTKPFENRLMTLYWEQRARVVSDMISYSWRDAHSTLAIITKRLTQNLLTIMPEGYRNKFLSDVKNVWPNDYFLRNVAPYLPGPAQQKDIIAYLNSSSKGTHEVDLIGRLLGYGTQFDKDTTLQLFTNEFKLDLFARLASSIPRHDGPDYGPYYKSNDSTEINLCKNIVFDINDYYTAQNPTPVKLDKRSVLVKMGVARPGDLLTWDGFCHLVAPFLEDPRPALGAAPTNSSGGQENTQAPTGAILDREALKHSLGKSGRERADFGHSYTGTMLDIDDLSFMGHMKLPHMPFGMMASTTLESRIADEILREFKEQKWFAVPEPKVEIKASETASNAAIDPKSPSKVRANAPK